MKKANEFQTPHQKMWPFSPPLWPIKKDILVSSVISWLKLLFAIPLYKVYVIDSYLNIVPSEILSSERNLNAIFFLIKWR